jgi:hypothetical protein
MSNPEHYREPLERDYNRCNHCRYDRQLQAVHSYFVCDYHQNLNEKVRRMAFRDVTTAVRTSIRTQPDLLNFKM